MTSALAADLLGGDDLGRGGDACLESGLATPSRAGLLISIQSRYANAILNGAKKVELRRRPPRSHPPIAVIYGSGSARSVLGTAQIAAIHTGSPLDIWRRFGSAAGVTRQEFDAYFAGCDNASALELTDIAPATKPFSLESLRALGLEPPQSWRYIDAEQLNDILVSIAIPHASRVDTAWIGPYGPALNRSWQLTTPDRFCAR